MLQLFSPALVPFAFRGGRRGAFFIDQGLIDMDFVALIQDFGLPVALVLFFVWQGKIREDRMTTRINNLENYIRDTLHQVVKDNTDVMRRLEHRLEKESK